MKPTTYQIEAITETCPFCPNGKPKKNIPAFLVSGPYVGAACATHLATLIQQTKVDEKPDLHVQAG